MAYTRVFFSTAARRTMKELGGAVVRAAKEEATLSSIFKEPEMKDGIIKGANEAKEIFNQATSFQQAVKDSMRALASNMVESTSKTRIASNLVNSIAATTVNTANSVTASLSQGANAISGSLMRQQGDEYTQKLSHKI